MAGSVLTSGPRRHLLRGNLPEFVRDRTAFLSRCARDYGDFVPLRFGPKRALLISCPEAIEQVLVTSHREFAKPYVLRTDRVRVDGGPPQNEQIVWRRSQLAQSVFHRTQVAGYGDVMVAAAQRTLAEWRDGETRDIVPDMMRLALVIVARTLFGAELDDEAAEVSRALSVCMDAFMRRLRLLFLVPERLPTPTNRRLHAAQHRLDGLMDRLLDRQLAQPQRAGLLSLLPAALEEGSGEQGVSRRRLREESMAIFIAGHETVALTLSWVWYLLSQHPEVEARLHEEIDRVLDGRPPTVADRPRLPYTGMIIQEALRLYPPIWVMARAARQPAEICRHPVVPGTLVLMSQWVLHRDPRYFSEPERFDPDRWAGDAAQRLPRFAYFPFGGGPHGCIGQGFALLEATLILATIAQRYRLRLAPGAVVEPEASITLRPNRGIPMRLESRV